MQATLGAGDVPSSQNRVAAHGQHRAPIVCVEKRLIQTDRVFWLVVAQATDPRVHGEVRTETLR
jgi:hypothetical protein